MGGTATITYKIFLKQLFDFTEYGCGWINKFCMVPIVAKVFIGGGESVFERGARSYCIMI